MQCKQIPWYRGPICSRLMSEEELKREKREHMNSFDAPSFEMFQEIPLTHSRAAAVIEQMDKRGVLSKNEYRILINTLRKHVKPLVMNATEYRKEIDYIIQKTKIMEECPSLNRYTVIVLVGQLLWGYQSVPQVTKETFQLLYYLADLNEEILEANTIFQNAYQAKLPIYIRVNTLSISLEHCINTFCEEGWNLLECPKTYSDFLAAVSNLKTQEFISDFHISELLVFPPCTSFYEHPGYLRGKFVLQDKASCLASFLLNPKPGSRVYDMCAAPGKTTNHLACIVNNEANVYATDFHPHRFNKMQSFIQLTKSTCVETMLANATDISIDNVNYVLLDAPSNYTGIFYKKPRNGLIKRLKQYFQLSYNLLLHAFEKFSTAKRIVYATCSIHPEEAEKVVDCAVRTVGDSYRLLDIKDLLWNQWISIGHIESPIGLFPSASKCLRTIPEFDQCHGYYIAVFERNFEVPMPPDLRKAAFLNGTLDFDKTIKATVKSESVKRKMVLEDPKTDNFRNKSQEGKKIRCDAPPGLQTSRTANSANQMLDSIWFE